MYGSFDMKELNHKFDLDCQKFINFIFEVKKHFIKFSDMALEQFKELDDIILNQCELNQDTFSRCNVCEVVFEQFLHLVFEDEKQDQLKV
jgi:hypothetical protein